MKQRLVILGAGESGTGAALLGQARGYDVFVSDANKISEKYKAELEQAGVIYEEGGHTADYILDARIIIKSPGISPETEIIQQAMAREIEIIDELEFAFRFTSAKIIAITGTNGKTTTTLLTYHLMKETGFDVGLAGNVGKSLARQLLDGEKDYYVVEISSFQLDGTRTFRPYISMLLNITPDHMDRYQYSLKNYVNSKLRIIQNQTEEDHFIYNAEDPILTEELVTRGLFKPLGHGFSIDGSKAAEMYYRKGKMYFFGFWIAQKDTPLRGLHNAQNIMAAVEALRILGADADQVKKALKTFTNAPHRLEYVATINDVKFFNDSKATNVDSVKYALDAFDEPLVWIAGGIDKGNDYKLIMEQVNKKVKALVCLGTNNLRLRDAFHDQIVDIMETRTMQDAVRGAMGYARANDVVLLSPACASFDLFRNYEDRGNQFRETVLALKEEFEKNQQMQ
ncbi:UDP-N-acetylmuramoyl-L-alanine--D-glutamate ligase [Fulvivirga sedimenti]|uniref:UDP-N-acetylmuramoylalanine--D-glutamate ligase n=1 Tax=Fulvivirga sedimenti TaxID=2879465 RepID=A0A9X1HL62_9BACT|nr:UDP-N-acetylmuramoyl-L-alanine--D-glutamate ligase [Fulvivirga sedimenti]MCA6073926.1 UDP-N-acetylmuramoyl-L-alanine--D-glutamate ligase [Fulvivirga sedimenti]